MKQLIHAINLVRNAARDLAVRGKRSPHWEAVERAFRQQHPQCQACGCSERLNVHHKRPFHLHPELELDPANLITLCMGPRECHLKLGHGGSFSAYSPTIEEDAALMLAHPELRDQLIAKSKANRLFE